MFGRRKREQDLDRELQSHLDLETEERGDTYAARRALGNRTRIAETVREAWGFASVDNALRTVRHASRSLRKRPVFALVAILSLALAIGANTAVFSLARGIVLKTLPVAGADRLVLIWQRFRRRAGREQSGVHARQRGAPRQDHY
jgi:putative ABC transport system permease protein